MRAGLGARRVFDPARPHFLADELREFFRADFAQPLEPRDLRSAAESFTMFSHTTREDRTPAEIVPLQIARWIYFVGE